MSIANNALIYNLALLGTPIVDNLTAGPASAQSMAARLIGELNRIVSAVANGSVILGSIASGEASTMTFVVNDSPNTIKAFPGAGESINGVVSNGSTTGLLSVPSGQSGMFVRVDNAHGGPDWRAVVIP